MTPEITTTAVQTNLNVVWTLIAAILVFMMQAGFALVETGFTRAKNAAKGKTSMKLIIAYIQPERLNAVKQALFAREIYKMSVTNALGCGKQGGFLHLYRGAVEEVTLHKKMRLAIGVNDDYIEKTVEAIIEGARTGDIGDGKIFVLPMDECVRIRTGERGPSAIG